MHGVSNAAQAEYLQPAVTLLEAVVSFTAFQSANTQAIIRIYSGLVTIYQWLEGTHMNFSMDVAV